MVSNRDSEPPVNLTLGDCSGERKSRAVMILGAQAIRNS